MTNSDLKTRPAIRPQRPLLPCVLLACSILLCASTAQAQLPAPSSGPAWRLAWSDEFNGPDGSAPDPAKWSFELGGSGFGNHELETYTDRPANAQIADGNLVLTALQEDATGPDGALRHYTSARLRTAAHFAQRYGRFEARMRLPAAKGLWPAFWLLGADIPTLGWPRAGEIDIMENIGDSFTVYSTLHGPGYSGGHALSAKFALPTGQTVDAAFHLYALEWAPNDIKFFFDDQLIAERTPASLPENSKWVYDHPFFLLLNLAVGGDWPGNPDATTPFPQHMLIDYVRVYTKAPAPPPPSALPPVGTPGVVN